MKKTSILLICVVIALSLVGFTVTSTTEISAQSPTEPPAIVWVEGDYWRYDPNTNDLEQLSTWGYNQFPVMAPNNQRIAYNSIASETVQVWNQQGSQGGDGPIASNIWVLNIYTGDGFRIAEQPAGVNFGNPNLGQNFISRSEPAWSPDGRYLVWSEYRIPSNQYFLVNYDFQNQVYNEVPIGFQGVGIPTPPTVRAGSIGMAYQDFVPTQEGYIPTFPYYAFNGDFIASPQINNLGGNSIEDFRFIEGANETYIGALDISGTWHLISTSNAAQSTYNGAIELYNPLAPNGYRVQLTANGVNSYDATVITGNNPAVPFFQNLPTSLSYITISPNGSAISYQSFGSIPQIFANGVNVDAAPVTGFSEDAVIWAYNEFRLSGTANPSANAVLPNPLASTTEPFICPNNLPPRLVNGRPAHVTSKGDLQVYNSTTTSQAPPILISSTETIDVLDGPFCAEGYTWWQVSAAPSATGWAIESEGNQYNLAPGDFADNAPEVFLPVLEVTQLGSGTVAYSGIGTNTNQVDVLLWGDRVTWTGNVVQNNLGEDWYQVRLGNGTDAYVMNLTDNFVVEIPGYQTSQATVGSTVEVTQLGAGMHLRTSFSTNAPEVQTLPLGQSMTIIGGPVYSEYYIWWEFSLPNGNSGYAVDVPGWFRVVSP